MKISTCWEGGQVNGYDIWMPEGSVGHISEDTGTLCSPETYREFGLPYTRKLIADYPQVMLHTHSGMPYILIFLDALPTVKVVQISNDPNAPRAIERYWEYSGSLEGRTVMLAMTGAEIEAHCDFLSERRTIIHYDAADLLEAQRLIEKIRILI